MRAADGGVVGGGGGGGGGGLLLTFLMSNHTSDLNIGTRADLPTRPYLPVLVRKSAGSMEVRLYFSKYGNRVSRKYGNRDVNDASLLPAKPILALMGSYHSLTFVYFKPFPGLKYKAGPDWSEKFVKPVNISFASKLYES